MIGHLYKDFKMAWMTFCLLGSIAILVICMAVLCGQDGGGTPAESAEDALVILSGLALLNMVAPLVAMHEAAETDEKERWADFVMVLPGGLKTYVCSKYLFIVLINVIVAIFTHLFCLVAGMLWNNPLWNQISARGEYMIIGTASGLGMLAASFFFPFVFRFGIRAGNVISTALVFCILLAFYIFLMFGDTVMLEDFCQRALAYLLSHYRLAANIIKVLLPVGIIAMLGSCALSVGACKYGMARREYWE